MFDPVIKFMDGKPCGEEYLKVITKLVKQAADNDPGEYSEDLPEGLCNDLT